MNVHVCKIEHTATKVSLITYTYFTFSIWKKISYKIMILKLINILLHNKVVDACGEVRCYLDLLHWNILTPTVLVYVYPFGDTCSETLVYVVKRKKNEQPCSQGLMLLACFFHNLY
jgi:hypothetical protein